MDVLTKASVTEEAGFAEIVGLIAAARQRAFQAVNTALIDLYWQVGEYISRKIETAEWGEGVVPQLAQYITRTQPGLRGFTRSNFFRMKQLYETYRRRCNCRGTAATIAVDTQPHHPWAEQTARGTRILSAHGDTGAVDQAASWSGSSTSLSLSTPCSPR